MKPLGVDGVIAAKPGSPSYTEALNSNVVPPSPSKSARSHPKTLTVFTGKEIVLIDETSNVVCDGDTTWWLGRYHRLAILQPGQGGPFANVH